MKVAARERLRPHQGKVAMLNQKCAAPRSGYAAMVSIVLASIFLHASSAAFASDAEPLDQLTIIAPSAAGGGYDLTAQAMRRVLESEKIAHTVKITRSQIGRAHV